MGAALAHIGCESATGRDGVLMSAGCQGGAVVHSVFVKGLGRRARHQCQSVGAAGGVGLAAVDLGLHYGAKVIATSTSSTKRDFLSSYGAHYVLPASDFKDKVKEFTNGHGADIIYDPVGGDVFDESVRCIGWNGRLLIIGFTSGRIPSVGVNMPLIKGFSVVGVRGGEYGRRDPEVGRKNLEVIDKLASDEKLNPHIHKTYPLERTIDALNELRNRTVIGKVCIKP